MAAAACLPLPLPLRDTQQKTTVPSSIVVDRNSGPLGVGDKGETWALEREGDKGERPLPTRALERPLPGDRLPPDTPPPAAVCPAPCNSLAALSSSRLKRSRKEALRDDEALDGLLSLPPTRYQSLTLTMALASGTTSYSAATTWLQRERFT